MSVYKLLETFRAAFQGKVYKHRDSSIGDVIASQLYEDLILLNKSEKLAARVRSHERVVNLGNKAVGKPSRRGDGTFGELVPAAVAITEAGLLVARGDVANIEIGEGEKLWPTDGKKHKHPIQEAEEAGRRLLSRAAPSFDEFQILRFRATNVEPFPFEWQDYGQTAREYSALLVRVSREYDRRF